MSDLASLITGGAAKALTALALRPVVERAVNIVAPQLRLGTGAAIDAKIHEFAEELRLELATIAAKEGLDEESAKAFSRGELLIRACRATIEERDKAKRVAYARLLARSMTPRGSTDYAGIEQALRIVIDCSEADFKMLGATIEVANQFTASGKAHGPLSPQLSGDRISAVSGLPMDRVLAHMERLQRLGLVRQEPTVAWGSTDRAYTATPLLDDLRRLLGPA